MTTADLSFIPKYNYIPISLSDDDKRILQNRFACNIEDIDNIDKFINIAKTIPDSYHRLAYAFCAEVARKLNYAPAYLTRQWRELHNILVQRNNAKIRDNTLTDEETHRLQTEFGWDERRDCDKRYYRKFLQKIPPVDGNYDLADRVCGYIAHKLHYKKKYVTSVWRTYHNVSTEEAPSHTITTPDPNSPELPIETEMQLIEDEQKRINERQEALDKRKQAVKARIQERRKKLEELERCL